MARLADLAIENYYNQYINPALAGRAAATVDSPVSTAPEDRPGVTTNNTGTGTKEEPDLASLAFGTPRGVGGTGYAGYNYTGFDFTQDAANRDIGKSAKYAFANATNKMGSAGVTADQWGTKAGAQEMAIKYIVPEMEANGFKVLEVVGDKMRIVTFEDYQKGNTKGTWVDFVVNADGAAMGLTPQLAWQPETSPDATDPTTRWTRPETTTSTTATTTTPSTTTPSPTTGTGTGTDTPTTETSTSGPSAFVNDELLRGRSLADLVY